MNDKTKPEPLHDNLRDLIGQAISDEIAGGAEQPDWCDSREIDRLADAVLAVLPAAKASEPAAAMPKDTPESMAESNTRFAIDGAIQYGREDRNKPPSADHWLMEYWLIGQQLRELGKTGWDNRTPLDPAEKSALAAPQEHAQEAGAESDVFMQKSEISPLAKGDSGGAESSENWNAQAAPSDELPPLPEPDYPAGCDGMLGEDCWTRASVEACIRATLATHQPAPVASAPAVAVPVDADKMRAQGRAEALAILMGLSAEGGIDAYTGWSKPVGPEDEGDAYWDEPKLRELFAVDGTLADMMNKAEAEHYQYLGMQQEAEHAKNFAANMHNSGKVRDVLAKAGEFDLIADLCSTAQSSTAQGDALRQQSAPTAQQERAWFKDWLAGLDGNITVDQVEFGRRVWAERARRATEGGT